MDFVDNVQTEFYYNEPTGVEVEETEGDPQEGTKPWDPELIRISTMAFSLWQVVDQIEQGDIELVPDFQRQFVWKTKQKSRLIESILLAIPLPSFYFNQDKSGKMQVVDGVQRLSTIYAFAKDERFALKDLEYLENQKGRKFSDLDAVYRRRFRNTQIYVNVIDPQTPASVKFDVFKRINTAGSPLNGQEIRHCMSGPNARRFLKSCAEEPALQTVTSSALKDHVRMADREVVLRFCAFSIGEESYAEHQSFDSFLTHTLEVLEKTHDTELAHLRMKLRSALELAGAIFGEFAFRKWPKESDKKNPINRALFEAWTVALSEHPREQLIEAKERIRDLARTTMTDDARFIGSISQSTGNVDKVSYRFAKVREIIQRAVYG